MGGWLAVLGLGLDVHKRVSFLARLEDDSNDDE